MTDHLRLLSLLALTGTLGTWARFGLGSWLTSLNPSFPWGTLAVNVVGGVAIGLIWPLAEGERALISGQTRVVLVVGFLGAFTTFSAFSLDVVRLAEEGRWLAAALNVAANNVLAIGGVCAGMAAGRAIVPGA